MTESTVPQDVTPPGPQPPADAVGLALRDWLFEDQRKRWMTGERPPASSYLERYAPLRDDPAAAADLVYNEYLLRAELGDAPDFDEYLAQYPLYADDLRLLHEADSGLEAAGLFAGAEEAGGQDFGDYELLNEIGHGGMGVVYRARQKSLGRLVALKMLLAGEWSAAGERARFRHEAEAAAGLRHPNIVAVHEVGERDGRLYFSMDFVEGQSLAQRVRESPLPPRQAATLIKIVARAVQHAHERGILHRDLKPSNILLDTKGRPLVTDFGLAKRAAADSELTETGHVLGTPSYMPPEQISSQYGKVGPASDVYALGATLYELLTGRPPLRAATPFETLRQVPEVEPVAPRLLNPRVPRDLDTICLKCLHKESDRRYGSAAELADDLRRSLLGEPIRARPVGLAGRAWRWCWRNQLVASLLGLLFVAIVAGLAVSLWQWRRADQEARQALQDKGTAQAERQRAEENLDMADQAVERMMSHLGNVRLADVPQATPIRRDLLLEARQLYQALLAQKPDDPKLRGRVAALHQQLGRVQTNLGQTEEALASLDQAVGVLQALAADYPDRLDFLRQLAACHGDRGLVLTKSRTPEAAQAYGEARRILDGLVKDHGGQARDRFDLAELHAQQWEYLSLLSHFAEMEAHCRQSLALLGQLRQESPKDTAFRETEARAHSGLAVALRQTKRRDEARQHYEAALVLHQQLHADQPGDSRYKGLLTTAHRNLARFLRDVGQIKEARQHYLAAQGLLKELLADFPDMLFQHGELAEVYHGLAWCAIDEENATEARDQLLLALKHQRVSLAADPRHLQYRDKMCHRLMTLAQVQAHEGEYQEAAEAAFEVRLFMVNPKPCADAVEALLDCVELAEWDESLQPSQCEELAERYAGHAVEVLRAGAKQGLVNVAALREMKLTRLEGREDYHKLLHELEVKGGGK